MLDTETGDCDEHRLKHSDGEAEKFYRDLKLHTPKIRVGLGATGHRRWFERLLMELDCEMWVGDAAWIATTRVRKQKTGRQDAQLLLKLMIEDRFPACVFPAWKIAIYSSYSNSHCGIVIERFRCEHAFLNQSQSMTMNEAIRRRWGLRSVQGRRRLEQIPLGPCGVRRRNDLLVAHPGVRPATALESVLIIGHPERLRTWELCGRQAGSN